MLKRTFRFQYAAGFLNYSTGVRATQWEVSGLTVWVSDKSQSEALRYSRHSRCTDFLLESTRLLTPQVPQQQRRRDFSSRPKACFNT